MEERIKKADTKTKSVPGSEIVKMVLLLVRADMQVNVLSGT